MPLFFLCGSGLVVTHTLPVGFEPTNSPSTLLLQGEGVPFELNLIGK